MRYKKVIYFMYLRILKTRFDQWNYQTKILSKLVNSLEYVFITKMKRRMLRLAFKKYRLKVKASRIDSHNQTRGYFYHHVVSYKAVKRMFKAIKTFARNHKVAKTFLKRTMLQKDIRTKKEAFDNWKVFHLVEKKEDADETQKILYKEIYLQERESGSLQTTNLV